MAIQGHSRWRTFGSVHGKPTKDYISLYSNVGFVSESSDHAGTQSTENCRFWPPTVVGRPSSANPSEYPHKVGPRLLLMTNRKSHTRFRLVPISTTLDDLEGPLRTLFQNKCVFRSPPRKVVGWAPILSATKCSPMTLDSGNIRFMGIFAVVLKIYVNLPIRAYNTGVGFGWLVDEVVWACAIVVLSVDVDIWLWSELSISLYQVG